MIRGKRSFRCSDCGKISFGFDIEWQATTRSMPIQCPKCGSKHTLPLGASKDEYEKIWEVIGKGK